MNKILLAIVSIALGGLLAYWALQTPPKAPEHPSEQPENAQVKPAKIYPVTPEMEIALKAVEGKPLYQGTLVDATGKSTALSAFRGRPLLLYFIQKECPCCVTAGPGVQRLADAFPGSVVGILDGDGPAVAKWVRANRASYPVLGDPRLEAIRHYGVERGTSMLLLGPDGKVALASPGYGREIFQRFVERLAALTGRKEPRLDWSDMPERSTSGCLFPLN
jgi:peroxiredoxin